LEALLLLAVALAEQNKMARQVQEVLVVDRAKYLTKIQQVLVKELLVKETLAVLVVVQRVVLITMAEAEEAVLELLV
jgi:hypothetical protein